MRVLDYSFNVFRRFRILRIFQQIFRKISLCGVDKKLEEIWEKSLESRKLPMSM